jgi:hypothetical protein
VSIEIPFSPGDFAIGLLFGILLMLFFLWCWRGNPDRDVWIVAFVLKLVASLAYGAIYLYYYEGISDSLTYHKIGVEYAGLLHGDVIEGIAEYPFSHPFLWFSGISTDRFENLCGPVHLLLMDSFIAGSFFFAALGFIGQRCLYCTFRACYPEPRLRLWWYVGILLFPSLVFWSSGMLKDSMGIFGLGLAVWGVHRLLHQRTLSSAIIALLGIYVMALFRAQAIPMLLIALCPWVCAGLRTKDRRPSVLDWLIPVGLIASMLAGFLVLPELDSRFSLSQLPESIQRERDVYDVAEGGSTVEQAGMEDLSWSELIVSTPGAIIFTLYRPFVWEASGAVMLIGAVENLVLLLLSMRALILLMRTRSLLGNVVRDPLFWACVLFVLLFAVAIGASTRNMGTVSRYRIPLIPFFAAALVIVECHALRARSGRPLAA